MVKKKAARAAAAAAEHAWIDFCPVHARVMLVNCTSFHALHRKISTYSEPIA